MALALSAVFGLAQVLPVLHFVLVAHQLCAEHGELVHADAGQDAAHASEQHAASSEAQLVGAAGESHAHDHCGVVGSGHAHGVRLTSPQGCLCAPSYLEAELSSARSAHSSIALLAYAPKLAPPSA
ncbi:MAG: hypothetical protein ABW217_19775 [Polyangiaceae bacterium]